MFRDYIPNHVISITEDKKQILLRDVDDYIPYDDFKKMMYDDYSKTNQYLFDLYKLNLKRFDNMDIDDPKMKEFQFDEIHKLIEQISYYLQYEESSSPKDEEVEFDDNPMDDYDEEGLNLLSETEIVTYIEEAIKKVTDEYIKLELINE